jgi:uncharacterized protein YjbI with pentapeptide repeats
MWPLKQGSPVEVPAVIQVASALYAHDQEQLERATQRQALNETAATDRQALLSAAAEVGLPPVYVDRAMAYLRRRQLRRAGLLTTLGMVIALCAGWRTTHRLAQPPSVRSLALRGGDLRGMDLRKLNLEGANLTRSDLRGTDLRGTQLNGAPLQGALIDARTQLDPKWRRVWELATFGGKGRDLREVDLYGANLDGADLRGASLRGKDLTGCALNRADLRGADLQDAILDCVPLEHVRYDQTTRWPSGFDPVKVGAVKIL